ncbi:hypothetical protein AL515_17645 [Citrobacter sp. FDAARGOS_156]|nr:hypothetical protein AL515_17645 [Citrobacter sp. FDAARGOS_156]
MSKLSVAVHLSLSITAFYGCMNITLSQLTTKRIGKPSHEKIQLGDQFYLTSIYIGDNKSYSKAFAKI